MSLYMFMRNALLGCALIGVSLLWYSVQSESIPFAHAGMMFVLLGVIGSLLPVHMKWGKYATWWFIVAYPDKYMPAYVFVRGCVTAFVMTLLFAYMYVARVFIPGYAWLMPAYFTLCMLFGGLTILLIVINARAFRVWMPVIDYIFKR